MKFSKRNVLSRLSYPSPAMISVRKRPTAFQNKKGEIKMKRRIASLLLALCMVLGLAATVSAEERYTSGDWTYTFSEGELSIISYNGSDTHVVVPEKLDGHPVRILGWGLTPAFSGVKNTMTSITLPEGLTHIERQCFKNCAKLTSVTLPSTVEHVSSSAFEGCSKLAKVELNEV